ncbi:MAG TPA: hypothetical protein PLX53_00485 [Tenuifilaceae bacterium]|nr:hypothetical protein [Tenuifilaceae bacterium]
MFDDYKYKKALNEINRQAQGFKRQRMVHNLTTARKILIVFTLNSQEVIDSVLNLVKYFESLNITVHALGYYPQKEVPQVFTMHPGITIFSKAETNWYGKPLSSDVEAFINKEYDILIDVDFDEVVPVRWISTFSKAKFKLGSQNYLNNPFDLILTVDKLKGLPYLCEQVKQVLFKLNNRFADEPHQA